MVVGDKLILESINLMMQKSLVNVKYVNFSFYAIQLKIMTHTTFSTKIQPS